MLKQLIALSIAATFIAGCTATPQQQPQQPSLTNAELTSGLQATQGQIIEALNEQCAQQSAGIAQLSKDIDNLNTQVNAAIAERPKTIIVPSAAPKAAPVQAQCPESPNNDKFMLGEVESVYVEELKTSFATRIDTGAESSSIDARNIVMFERDGVRWVRFDVMLNGEDQPPTSYEAKIARYVRIKQDADTEDDRRPVIHAHLKIGKFAAETDLNLTDRSHLDYPLLLGRKFMKDIAIVDVGQMYIQGKPTKQTN